MSAKRLTEEEKHSRRVNLSMSQLDYDCIKLNLQNDGYQCLSAYVVDKLARKMPRRDIKWNKEFGEGLSGELAKRLAVDEAEIQSISRQIKGIASNYNQATAEFHALAKKAQTEELRTRVIKRSYKLEQMTRETIRHCRRTEELFTAISEDIAKLFEQIGIDIEREDRSE